MVRPMVAPVGSPNKKAFRRLPITTRTKARNLYVLQGLSPQDVAAATGLEPGQVSYLANYYGWSSMRRKSEAHLSAEIDSKAVNALSDEISDAIVAECEEIALGGLAKAKIELTSPTKDAAKNFQAWTAGVRNLTSARAALRSGKGDTSGITNSDTRQVNLFFMAGSGVRRELVAEKVVEGLDEV